MDWMSSLEALKASLPKGDDNMPETPRQPSAADSVEKARLDVLLDKKGRKGKAATIVVGFTIPDEQVEDVARRLRQRLGTGGSSRGGEILIQGDKRREVAAELAAMVLECRII